jgi:hypothetical protein
MSWHKRLLSADIEAGKREWYWSNPDTGEVTIQGEFLVTPIAEDCKGLFNAVDERAPFGNKKLFHHVGVIPLAVLDYEYRTNKRTLKDREFWRNWLNDSANRAFRTRPGRV